MDQVEEVKQKTDIVSIVSERVTLKKAGRNFKGLCPFHGEKTPSFMVSPELQIFKCFGCQKSGDAFSFLEEYEGMDFYEALKYLAGRAAVTLKPIGNREFSDKEKLYQANDLAGKYYQFVLLNHPSGKPGLSYLTQKRGISPETIKIFGLGFAPNSSQPLSHFLISKKKFSPETLEKAGISFRGRSGLMDRFRGRVIFPLYDHRGNSVGLAGRLLPEYESESAGWRSGKYINSPETSIYHKGMLLYGLNVTKGDIKKNGSAVVVEGELDLISSWQAGIKNIVAIKGTAITADQVKLLARLCNRLILALDADVAGDAADRRGIEIAQSAGMEVRVVVLGKYKDPDEFARADPQGFKKAIHEATNIWDFIISSIFAKADAGTGEGKAKISREIVPILSAIEDKIVAAHYIKLVAAKLGVSEEVVNSQIEKRLTNTPTQSAKDVFGEKVVKRGRAELLEERLLSLSLLCGPEFLKDEKIVELFSSSWAKRVLTEFAKASKKFVLLDFIKSLPQELSARLSELILEEGKEEEDPTKLKNEIETVAKELKKIVLKRKMEAISTQITQAEGQGDEKLLQKLKHEFAKVSASLGR